VTSLAAAPTRHLSTVNYDRVLMPNPFTIINAPLIPDTNIYDDGYLRVEHDNYFVTCDGCSIRLPRSQFLIISRLVRSPRRVVAREELWTQAWGETKPFNAVSLHVYIYRLRRNLRPFGLIIETVVNVGYKLVTKEAGSKSEIALNRLGYLGFSSLESG
jgi:DNA-binding response OmpR family regulator